MKQQNDPPAPSAGARERVKELSNKCGELSHKHFDMGGIHAKSGTLHCTCDLAKEYRETSALLEAARNDHNREKLNHHKYSQEELDAALASERARADAAERDAKVCNLDAERYYKRARELDAEVESLRSELREAREEIKRLILQYTVAECWWDDTLQ